MNVLLLTIYIRNKSSLLIIVYKLTNLNCLIKFKEQDYYQINFNKHN